MGTNFYWRGRKSDHPDDHIGKRSAAGPYCWDCRETLCKDGISGIHSSDKAWHKECPKCGAAPVNAVARELGFDVSKPTAKHGVVGCASFSWAQPREIVLAGVNADCPTCHRPWLDPEKVIEDEYGRLYTLEEFKAVLTECPIEYTRNVGEYFS